MNLSLKLSAAVGAGVCAIVLATAAMSARAERAIIEEDLRRDARLMATSVAAAVADLPADEAEALIARVDRQSEDIQVRFISARTPVARESGPPFRAVASTGAGSVEVIESPAIRDRMLRGALRELFATSLLVMVVALIAGHGAGRLLLGRRVELLVRKAARVGAGDFGEPIEVRGDDELDYLGRGLNRMARQLAEARAAAAAEADQRVSLEVQLRHADRLRAIGQIAAGRAHELGTPLNVISGRATLLTRTLKESPAALEHASAIGAQADRIAAVVRRVLDYSRASTPSRTTVDLATLVEEAVPMLRTAAEGASLEVDASGPVPVFGDPGQLQQVVTNLVMNAAQATPQGTVRVVVRGDAGAALRVEDDGPGVAASDRERVLEPFFTTKEAGAGTGLGLSISKAIVEEHGGSLTIASSELGGALVTVELPLEEEPCRA